jgi:hypothetical protein
VISVFLPGSNDFCALLELYAAQKGIFLQTFRDNLSTPSSRDKQSVNNYSSTRLNLEDGTDRLSQNVGKKLLLYVAQNYKNLKKHMFCYFINLSSFVVYSCC